MATNLEERILKEEKEILKKEEALKTKKKNLKSLKAKQKRVKKENENKEKLEYFDKLFYEVPKEKRKKFISEFNKWVDYIRKHYEDEISKENSQNVKPTYQNQAYNQTHQG